MKIKGSFKIPLNINAIHKKQTKEGEQTNNTKKEPNTNYRYSFEKRFEIFKNIVSLFVREEESYEELFKKYENSGLRLPEFINGLGYSFEEIARRIASAFGKEYREKPDEDVFLQGYILIGKTTGKSYSFISIADVVIPYNIFVNYAKNKEIAFTEERGEIQRYIYSLFERGLNIDMTDLFLDPDLNYYYVSYKELGGGRKLIEILDKSKGRTVVNALKVMAAKTKDSNIRVNIDNETQSGKIRVDEYGIEIRIEFTPTILGEAVSMRFFKLGGYFNTKLEDLGYDKKVIEIADHISKLSKGMVLVSGATGQGKSTFIRSIILRANPEHKVVRAVEDPVESIIKGVSHVQVKEGLISFSSAIRSFMRANPDIIFVGEVRDPETAIALIEASITGHLTFSTTHATSSITAISRVLAKAQEKGIFSREELLSNIASSLVASFTQRLVKLTEKGQVEYGRKVLPVVEYFVPDKEDRQMIEEGRILDLLFKLKEQKADITSKLKQLYENGYIDEETYVANIEVENA